VDRITVAVPLADDLAARIAAELPGRQVRFEPDLLPPPRYACDHRGDPGFHRDRDQERRWAALLAEAEVLYGIPGDDPQELRRLVRSVPGLRFVQATAAGAGQQVAAAGLTDDELERVAVASSSGVHAGPLAEFATLGMLALARDLPRLERDRAARRWDHYATPDLAGRTAVVLGTGAIGSRIARVATALGLRVVGVNTTGRPPGGVPLDEVTTPDRLRELAPRADVLLITLPELPETVGLVDRAVLGALPRGAVVVNVGRGRVVDEAALVELLGTRHLAGAALDVTAEEPLPADSPLWELPNVILSPHTAALSPREDERIVDLFLDNLRRLEDGRPLRNRITTARRY
jgi:phosphoglycerate dehydrogenase-like enzyme